MTNKSLTALGGLVYPEPCVVTLLVADLAAKVDRTAVLAQSAAADRIVAVVPSAVLVQNAVTRDAVPIVVTQNAAAGRIAVVDPNAAVARSAATRAVALNAVLPNVVIPNAVIPNAACLARGGRAVFREEHRSDRIDHFDRVCRRRGLAATAEARVELRLRSVEFLLPQELEQEQEPLL